MAKSEDEIREELRLEYAANMQEELTGYRKALEQELGTLGELNADDPDTVTKVRNKLLLLVPDAYSAMSQLINHADSEAVRANLSKFVFTEAIGKAKTQDEEDELRKLLGDLKPSKTSE